MHKHKINSFFKHDLPMLNMCLFSNYESTVNMYGLHHITKWYESDVNMYGMHHITNYKEITAGLQFHDFTQSQKKKIIQ